MHLRYPTNIEEEGRTQSMHSYCAHRYCVKFSDLVLGGTHRYCVKFSDLVLVDKSFLTATYVRCECDVNEPRQCTLNLIPRPPPNIGMRLVHFCKSTIFVGAFTVRVYVVKMVTLQ